MKKLRNFLMSVTLISALSLLTACGGSGGSTNPVLYFKISTGIQKLVIGPNTVTTVATVSGANLTHIRVSPDGTQLLFSDSGNLYYVPTAGGTPVAIPGYKFADWLPNTNLIIAVTTTNKVRTLLPNGTNVSPDLFDGNFGIGISSIDANATGTKVVMNYGPSGWQQIYSMNPDGTGSTSLTPAGVNSYEPRWNPAGTLICFERNLTIFTIDSTGANLLQITNGPNPDSGAIFRSNGDILLVTAISGGSGIYSVDSTGNNRQQIYDMADNEMWPEIFE